MSIVQILWDFRNLIFSPFQNAAQLGINQSSGKPTAGRYVPPHLRGQPNRNIN
ncbi:2981_t:CDS:1, partial [Dentiscutata heterogama]